MGQFYNIFVMLLCLAMTAVVTAVVSLLSAYTYATIAGLFYVNIVK